jgi:8-oxo-dGTP diphosphatase
MRHRVGGIIIKDNKILLIHRYKIERGEYYIFPGGGVEENENLEQACIRELKEETNLDVSVGDFYAEYFAKDYPNGGQMEHYYLIKEFKGELKLGGPELQRQSENNSYKVVWIDLNTLQTIDLAPITVKEKIIKDFVFTLQN